MELPEIAALVAKAFKLMRDPIGKGFIDPTGWLRDDGHNVCDPYWQVRCRDWLFERGYSMNIHQYGGELWTSANKPLLLNCPAFEFCARAIAQIMKEKE